MIASHSPEEKSTGLNKEARKRILLADSDQDYRLLLASLLSEEGHRVFACSDVQVAMGAVEKEQFDFVIIGHSVPALDGLSLLEQIKKGEPRNSGSSARSSIRPRILPCSHEFGRP